MKILLHGSCGRMGKEVAALAQIGYHNAILVAGIDPQATGEGNYTSLDDVPEDVNADCIVDFSHHSATPVLLRYAVAHHLPVVLSTTGQTEEEQALIDSAAKEIPIFHSANMSLGVALLVELAKKTVAAMPDADIEIVEMHHNRKLDAPSGTALMLANAIREVRKKARFVFGRSGHGKREQNEIGIHAIRMGNIVGTHEVIVGTDSQTITLRHEAHSRTLFAEGALTAVEFLVGKPAGLYDMQSMINN